MRSIRKSLRYVSRHIERKLGIGQVNYFDDDNFLEYVSGKSRAFKKNISHIKTLAMLSSHADYGFYPDAFPGSFNLGLTSSDLHAAFHLYAENQEKLKDLQRVILFFSVFSNGYSLIKTKARYRAVSYRYYLGIPYQCKDRISRLAEWRINRKCRRFTPSHISEGAFGYQKKTFFYENIDFAERAATHLRENRRTPDQIIWLERLAELTRKNGHALYVVISPARSDYRAALPPKEKLFEKVLGAGIQNLHVIDCFDGPLATDDLMGDSDHLNEAGAKALTLHLRRVISDMEDLP